MPNTEIAHNGIEVYTSKIFELADDFINRELGGDEDKVRDSFPSMILFIADRIPKPSNDDIELLDDIFQIYVKLCAKYGRLPTLEMFGMMIKLNPNTLSAWRNKEYRGKLSDTYSLTVQKWKDICKSFTVDRLHNQNQTNVNLIFIAKSVYGMSDQPQPQIAQQEQRVLSVSELPKLGNFSETE